MPNARRNPPAGATPPAPPSAPPSPTSERTPNWFICPQCQLTKFGTANPQCFATGEPQILECHGLASDGPPFGCGWKGTWDDVRDGRIRNLEKQCDQLRSGLTEITELHPINSVQAAILLAKSALSKASH